MYKFVFLASAIVMASPATAEVITLRYGAPLEIAENGGTDPLFPILSADAVGTITDLNVFVEGYSHDSWRDVDFVLALQSEDGSTTERAVVLRAEGNLEFDTESVSDLNLVFDDEAADLVPVSGLTSGTYQPTDYWDYTANQVFGDLPISLSLAEFADGISASRQFGLFAFDYFPENGGSFTDWGLEITFEALDVPAPGMLGLVATVLSVGAFARRRQTR
ncbi:MAG: hypothetical protein AAGF15_02220 [Pseudomonadota bacterium]